MARHLGNQPKSIPPAIFRGGHDDGGEKCVRCLGGVIEHDLAITIGQRGQAGGEIGMVDRTANPVVREMVHGGHARALPLKSGRRKRDKKPDYFA